MPRFKSRDEWQKDGAKIDDGLSKYSVAGIEPISEKELANTERALQWKMSDESRDRDGDRIMQRGWDLNHYSKNPVVLFAHNYRSMPIGKALKTWVGETAGQGPHLKTVIQFTPRDLNPEGHMAYELAQHGYLSGASVGFLPKSYEQDERQPDEDEDTKVGYRFTKTHLLENSIVPVPAHPNALVEARSIHGIDLDPLLRWCEGVLDHNDVAHLLVPRKTIEEVHSIIRPQRAFFFSLDPKKPLSKAAVEASIQIAAQEILEKTAVPYRRFNLADKGRAYDDAAERSSAAIGDLYWMSTLWDPETSEDRGSYQLLHHHANDLATNWNAVRASMAALLGGGVPEADRPFAYQHLKEHFLDFQEQPPELRAYSDAELKGLFPDLDLDALRRSFSVKTPRFSQPPDSGPIDTPEKCLSTLSQCADFLLSGPELSKELLVRIDNAIDLADTAIDMIAEEMGVSDPDADDGKSAKAKPPAQKAEMDPDLEKALGLWLAQQSEPKTEKPPAEPVEQSFMDWFTGAEGQA